MEQIGNSMDSVGASTSARSILLIGIAGGMGSGKTSLSRLIAARCNVPIIRLKWFLRAGELAHTPASYEIDDLERTLAWLSAVRTSGGRTYNYRGHIITWSPVMIITGLYTFLYPTLMSLLKVKIFIDCDADTRLCRMIRGLTVDVDARQYLRLIDQYESTASEMNSHLIAQRASADLIVEAHSAKWSTLNDILHPTIADAMTCKRAL